MSINFIIKGQIMSTKNLIISYRKNHYECEPHTDNKYCCVNVNNPNDYFYIEKNRVGKKEYQLVQQ